MKKRLLPVFKGYIFTLYYDDYDVRKAAALAEKREDDIHRDIILQYLISRPIKNTSFSTKRTQGHEKNCF